MVVAASCPYPEHLSADLGEGWGVGRQWRGASSGAEAVLRRNSESESDWPEIESTQGPRWKQGHVSTKVKVEVMWVVRSIPDLCAARSVAQCTLPLHLTTH